MLISPGDIVYLACFLPENSVSIVISRVTSDHGEHQPDDRVLLLSSIDVDTLWLSLITNDLNEAREWFL